jgi:hypothetical protein
MGDQGKLCEFCQQAVLAGTDESKWGFEYGTLGTAWAHYRCADNFSEASRRVRRQPEYAALKAELALLRKEQGQLRAALRQAGIDIHERLCASLYPGHHCQAHREVIETLTRIKEQEGETT